MRARRDRWKPCAVAGPDNWVLLERRPRIGRLSKSIRDEREESSLTFFLLRRALQPSPQKVRAANGTLYREVHLR